MGRYCLFGSNREILDQKFFKTVHFNVENHNTSLENKCPIAEDNGPICMVMVIWNGK